MEFTVALGRMSDLPRSPRVCLIYEGFLCRESTMQSHVWKPKIQPCQNTGEIQKVKLPRVTYHYSGKVKVRCYNSTPIPYYTWTFQKA